MAEKAEENAVIIAHDNDNGNISVPVGKVKSADSGTESTPDAPLPETQLPETTEAEAPIVEEEEAGNDDVTEHAIFLPFVQR